MTASERGTSRRKGGLGRGLASLIPTGPADGTGPATLGPKIGDHAADVLLGGAPRAAVATAEEMGAVYREIPPADIEPNPPQPRPPARLPPERSTPVPPTRPSRSTASWFPPASGPTRASRGRCSTRRRSPSLSTRYVSSV